MTGQQSRRRSELSALADIPAVSQVVKRIRGKASEQATVLTHTLAQTLREHSQTVIDDQKSRVATEIQHLGAAVRSAADRLNDEESSSLARYVDTAAESIDGIAEYLD